MAHRFFIVIYALLHIPLLFTLGYFFDDRIWTNMNNSVYQVRCDNNEVVVLQGETEGLPYTFDDTNLGSYNYRQGAEETARFYCTYYDQIQPHINAYVEAEKTGGNTYLANQEYFKFRESVPETYRTNYTFEKIGEDNSYYQLWAAIIGFVVSFVVLFTFTSR